MPANRLLLPWITDWSHSGEGAVGWEGFRQWARAWAYTEIAHDRVCRMLLSPKPPSAGLKARLEYSRVYLENNIQKIRVRLTAAALEVQRERLATRSRWTQREAIQLKADEALRRIGSTQDPAMRKVLSEHRRELSAMLAEVAPGRRLCEITAA